MPDMREEFEAWVWDIYEETLWFDMNREFVLKRNGDEYFGNFLNDRWEAWKASRAALMKDYVPMPRQCPSWLEDTYDDVACPDTNYIGGLCLPAYEAMLKAQEEALQQAGIEVKP
ncbi:TPA: hypothetical protein L5G00_002779 [Pseudomonas aeruginosa]|nr:hypothetical protein [Pseudomonas aeruginosa]